MKFIHYAVPAALAAAALSSPSFAAGEPVPTPDTCSLLVVTGAIDCAGYYGGNIFGGSADMIETQTWALQSLGFVGTPDFDTIYANGSGYKVSPLNGATSVSFAAAPLLSGITYVGIHWGGNQSAIFKLNLTTPVSSISFAGQNPGGSSNAVLFGTGVSVVPEPATWAMMIGGLGIVGVSMRRRKVAVSFA